MGPGRIDYEDKNKDKDLPFESLTPSEVEEMSTYEKAFNYSFTNNNIKNIAVSGSYGSGKSSVVETYFKGEGKEYNHITISLANFSEADVGEDLESSEKKMPDEKTREKIEGKILNQIIHQVDPKKIPLTKFKVIKKHSPDKTNWMTSAIVLFMFLTLYLLNFERWKGLSKSINIAYLDTITAHSVSFFVALLIWIIIGFLLSFLIIRKQLIRPMFRKIIINDYEVEIFEEEDSYFDKHLNEIIYVLENSKVRAIIFEDIDRYQTNQVFSKLREINFLVNKKITSGDSNENGIKFFYLLKDEIFQSKDRTKFFDFIIPIIPVIDSSNSVNYLVRVFKDKKELGEFEEHFLERISLYIDDMRLLKNIINEYFIYRDRIQQQDSSSRDLLRDSRLFSIITYKNIFPKDFTALQFNSGFVFTLFTSYFELKKNAIILEKENIIEKNNKLLNNIDDEHLRNSKELDLLRQSLHYMTGKEYDERKQIISQKKDEKIKEIETKNRFLKKEVADIQNLNLKEFFSLYNENPLDDADLKDLDLDSKWFIDVVKNPYKDLILYLIKEGLIDETYQDYITYFYDDYLRLNDKTFLRSITDQRSLNFAHKLSDPKMIADKLKSSDFLKPQLLNFHLLEYAALNKKTLLKNILNLIDSEKTYDFLYQYLDLEYLNKKQEVIDQIFSTIIESKPSILLNHLRLDLDSTEAFENNKMISNAFWNLKFENKVSHEDLYDGISFYISCAKGILSDIIYWAEFRGIVYKEMFEKLIELDVKFREIDTNVEVEITKDIILNNLYEINNHNLNLLAKIFTKRKSFSYTAILNKDLTEVIGYLEDNLDELIDVLLEMETINEDDLSVIRLINSNSIDDDKKTIFLNRVETSINKLNQIKDVNYWSITIERDIVFYSKENVLSYFNHYGEFDSPLSRFINNNEKDLKIQPDELELHDKFYEELLLTHNLNNDKVKMLLQGSKFNLSELDVKYEEIPEDTFLILFDLNLVDVTVDLLKFIKEHYEHLIETLLLNRFSEVAHFKDYVDFDYSTLIETILEKESISEDVKLDILKYFVGVRIMFNKRYSLNINKEIIDNHNSIEQIRKLIDNDNKNDEITEHLVAFSNKHEDLTDENWKYPYEFLKRVLSLSDNNSLTQDSKEKILLKHLKLLDLSQSKELLFIIRKRNLASLLQMEGKQPRLEKNSFNLKVVEHFKLKEWISSFEPNEKEIIARAFRRNS